MVHIELPKEYSYVIGAGLFSTFVLAYLGGRVAQARTKYGVKLPSLYADEARAEKDENARIFNCIQRGHQNALETYPSVLMMLFIGGLKHPIICAAAGVIWSVGRIAYANGYATGDPKLRTRGGFMYLGLISLIGATVSTALSIAGVLKF